MTDQGQMASNFVRKRLLRWASRTDDRETRAELAQLRRGIGTSPGELPEIWALLFDGIPEELLSTNGVPTKAEWAITTALTLYALHQQGSDIRTNSVQEEGVTLGMAARKLAGNDEEKLKAVRRRFNAVVMADDMTECAYYLRGMVQLLKASGIALDYVQLTRDLYWFQTENGRSRVKLRWGQDFYRFDTSDKEDNNNE